MKTLMIAIFASVPWLAGCSPDQAPATPKLFESQRQALEKAKTVNDSVQQQAEQQQQEIDRQGQ